MPSLKQPCFFRQRFLLHLLHKCGGRLSKIDLQKLLFLLNQDAGFAYYDFVPYHYGCYSFQAQSDIEVLEKQGWLATGAKTVELISQPENNLKSGEVSQIGCIADQYKSYRGEKLVRYVYEKYPYYAIRSKIAGDILDDSHYKKVIVEKNKLLKRTKTLFTLGYEGITFEQYINKLIQNDVRLLCDVRKNPLSRKFGFSKGTLSRVLPKLGIQYVHIPGLGIQSEKRKNLDSQDDYARLFKKYAKTLPDRNDSLNKVLELLNEHKRIALTCFEKHHHSCHRHCVSDYLQNTKDIRTIHL